MSSMENTGTKKKVSTKKTSGQTAADHPKYSEMIKQALMALKERGGSSRQAVLKYIMANFKVGRDEASVNSHLKMALKAGVKNSTLKQSKGTGATGSFRLGTASTEKKQQPKKKQQKKDAQKKAASGKVTAKKAPASKAATKPAAEKVAPAPKKKAAAPVKAKKSGGRSTPKSPKKVVKKAAAAPAKKPQQAKSTAATTSKKAASKKVTAKKAVKTASK